LFPGEYEVQLKNFQLAISQSPVSSRANPILEGQEICIDIWYIYIYIYIYIPNMYLESYMSRVLDIPKYRANKYKDKINLVYFIRFIH
jgi:hypothetical protein